MEHVISEQVYKGDGLKREIIKEFSQSYRPAERIAFYPSSWLDIKQVLDLGCDANFFSDYSLRPSLNIPGYSRNTSSHDTFRQLNIEIIKETDDYIFGRKSNQTIYLFYADNNEVLQLITYFYKQLNVFIGVCDGCVEGGNYECVNNLPFLEKVIRLAPPGGMDIYTDHSDFLDLYPQYIFGNRIISLTGILPNQHKRSSLRPIRQYRVNTHTLVCYVWKDEFHKLTIEFDNILNHTSIMDSIFCSPLCCMLAKHYYGVPNKKIWAQNQYFF